MINGIPIRQTEWKEPKPLLGVQLHALLVAPSKTTATLATPMQFGIQTTMFFPTKQNLGNVNPSNMCAMGVHPVGLLAMRTAGM